MLIGERLRAARREREMSLADLARATHLSKGFISQVESGLSSPSLQSLRKLAGALGFAPGSFLDDASHVAQSLLAVEAGLGPATNSGNDEVALYSSRTLGRSPRDGGVAVIADGEQGTAALVTLFAGETLEASDAPGAASGPAICAVMLGWVRIRRGNSVTVVRQGEVALFTPERPYQIVSPGATQTTFLLTLPPGSPLPARIGAVAFQTRAQTFTQPTGPLRLVEMRASRSFPDQRGR